jgi:DtxR family transcriptional regulator, Mn-dependent transcriptional regulator
MVKEQGADMLSEAMQDYLKTIYSLQESDHDVATSALAERLGVAAPSVTGMVKKLAALKLVRHQRYQGVRLTKAGERVALEVLRHHRLLELYLAEALGYSWDQVHAEAERLEHVISEEFEERMFHALGQPTQDPHGHPIPTKEGKVASPGSSRLADLPPGAQAVISGVSDRDPEMLRYLGERGLVPETAVTVMARAPFNGPITVKAGRASHVLGTDLAREIRVQARQKRTA